MAATRPGADTPRLTTNRVSFDRVRYGDSSAVVTPGQELQFGEAVCLKRSTVPRERLITQSVMATLKTVTS